MILVAVGTFAAGFDALIEAADRAARALGCRGLAQIGHGRFLPETLRWLRFLPHEALQRELAAASLVICHGGMGMLGDAMRARRPIVAVPRRGPTTRANPANDQLPLLRKLAAVHPITVCESPGELASILPRLLERPLGPVDYRIGSNTAELIADFLRRPR